MKTSMKTGAKLIAAERQRQIKEEEWTTEHDARHIGGQLNSAAVCYAQAAEKLRRGMPIEALHPPTVGVCPWPWHGDWWKPTADPVRNLVKAGALIAAEIDRLQRAKTEAV